MNDLMSRMIVDGEDREVWAAARVGGIGGSNAAMFSKVESWPLYLKAILGESFVGNAYTRHGNDREERMLRAFRFPTNRALFRSVDNPRHISTPDGILFGGMGGITIAEAKTSSKPLWKVPPNYQRQCQWNMYVIGAERCLFMWEEHLDFRPLSMEPESVWIERDDAAIEKLVTIADLVLHGMDEAAQFRKELGQ